MDNEFSVMLAADATEKDLVFPAIGSPKIDGWRYCVRLATGYTRSGKPVPNRATQSFFGHQALERLDGELVVGSPSSPDVFNTTQSGLLSEQFDPKALFLVFDVLGMAAPFYKRLERLDGICRTLPPQFQGRVLPVAQVTLHNVEEFRIFESNAIDAGFEGLMVRNPNAPYKHGRSTLDEGGMLRIKRFTDADAVVIGMEEEVGDDRIPKNTMGALVCFDIKTSVQFNIGTGFKPKQRVAWWARRDPTRVFTNKVTRRKAWHIRETAYVKYKYFPYGTKNSPRHPVFLAERAIEDMEVVKA